MEIKANDATYNRPEGDRILDAPYVFADLKEFVRQLKEEEAWAENDRNGITVFKSDNLSVVLVCLKDKAIFADRPVNGLFTVQVMEGVVRVSTDEGEVDLRESQLAFFHPGINHQLTAVDDAVVVLTNYTL